MDVKPFDQSVALITALRQQKIPEAEAQSIVTIQRGPARSFEAMMLAYDYYLADPGDREAVSLDDVTRAMQDAAASWPASVAGLNTTVRALQSPERAAHARALAELDWNSVVDTTKQALGLPPEPAKVLFDSMVKFGNIVRAQSLPTALTSLNDRYATARANAEAFAEKQAGAKWYPNPQDALDAAWTGVFGVVAVGCGLVAATVSAPAVATGFGIVSAAAAINSGYAAYQFGRRRKVWEDWY